MTKIPRSLEEGLRDGRVIPFVGAGVSMAVERAGGGRIFPSWKQLLLDGAARLKQESKNADVVRALVEDDPPDYLQAAKKLRDKLGPLWGAFLKDEIDVSRIDVADGSLALAQAVWRLGSRLVVTTNYDQVLRWACPESGRDDLKIWDVNAPAEKAEYLRRGEVRAPTVWHLHGHIDNAAELILTPDGYASLYPAAGEAEPRHKAALETLRHLLASRSFLFIGFSLDDENFGVELQRMLDTFEGFGGSHYALVHQRDVERLRRLERPVEPVVFEDFGTPLLDLMGDLARHAGPAHDLGPVDVYLAEVADTLRQIRQRVYDDLKREAVSVAWEVPPPYDAESHRQKVTDILKRSRLSVHLLDGYAGPKIYDKPETTYLQEQVRLAREQARSQIIWVPRQQAEIEDSQKALLTELRSGGGLHEGTPPSELVQDILARLRQERPLPDEPQAILLDGHPRDEKVLSEVEGFLKSRVRTYVYRDQGDVRDSERFRERLQTVGALVICHGAVEVMDWVRANLAQAFTTLVNRPAPVYVYLAPPEKDLQIYSYYNFLQDLKKLVLLPNQHGPLEARTFAPLFERLGLGGPA